MANKKPHRYSLRLHPMAHVIIREISALTDRSFNFVINQAIRDFAKQSELVIKNKKGLVIYDYRLDK